jgi:hypothetical protein
MILLKEKSIATNVLLTAIIVKIIYYALIAQPTLLSIIFQSLETAKVHAQLIQILTPTHCSLKSTRTTTINAQNAGMTDSTIHTHVNLVSTKENTGVAHAHMDTI